MKKILLFLCAAALLSAVPGATACSSGDPAPDPAPAPTPDPDPEPDPKPVADDASIAAYFTACLGGEAAVCDIAAELADHELQAAADRVWKLWKEAVKRTDTPVLPGLSSHPEADSWGSLTASDGAWRLPDGDMHFIYASKGDRPAAGYPLFIQLHGSGEAMAEWQANLAWSHYYSDAPSAYFVPRSPAGGTGCRWFPPSRQLAWERVIRQGLVSDEIDPARIYFTGISEGAYGSQRLASFYADYLAGAGPIAGGELLSNAPPENCANLAFCLQTGAEDTMYGRSRLTQRAADEWAALQQAHPGCYVHKIDLQPDRDHHCDYTVTSPWHKNYSRVGAPGYFCWENFGMGDALGESRRYREGFCNLRVLEPSDDRTDDRVRSCYELTAGADNTIDLTVRVVTVEPCDPVSEDGWTMNIGVTKRYAPARNGRVRIYLDDRLADLSKPVRVRVNGTERFHGRVRPDLRHLVESCAFWFDPLRLFPAAVEVDIR